MNKLLLTLLFVPPLFGMDKTLILHKGNMYVQDEDASYCVQKHEMNPLLREVLKRNALTEFKRAGYIQATKNSDKRYELAAKVRGLGGTGPITAGVVNFAVRFGCWTGFLLAASTPVIVGTAVSGPGGAVAAGTGVQAAITTAGGFVAVASGIEAVATKATLATLLCPLPLP